jgi:FMN phosphatase YigB (HAD superfamily)
MCKATTRGDPFLTNNSHHMVQIFAEIFTRLQKSDQSLEPQNCVFIDDKTTNVEAAKCSVSMFYSVDSTAAFGFKGIAFNAEKQHLREVVEELGAFGIDARFC